MQIAIEISEKLGIEPTLKLKKKIRGLPGFTAVQLIDSLINTASLKEAAVKLGYSSDRAVKTAISEQLLPCFSHRKQEFGIGGNKHSWQFELLNLVGKKYCSKCGIIKEHKYFHYRESNSDKCESECKACKNTRNTRDKEYIALRTPKWAQLEEITKFYANCPTGFHVDHIVPLRGELVSGLHVIENLQYLEAKINIAKSNKYVIE